MQVERLPVFWKQQRLMFFDAFSFAFPAALQRIPYSVLVSLIWTVVTYWAVGLAGQPSRCSSSPCLAQLLLPLFGTQFFLPPLGTSPTCSACVLLSCCLADLRFVCRDHAVLQCAMCVSVLDRLLSCCCTCQGALLGSDLCCAVLCCAALRCAELS